MNLFLCKHKKSNGEVDKIMKEHRVFTETRESIIPLENKRVVIPFCYSKYIINNTFSKILSPIDARHSDVFNTNFKGTNNVFSLRNKKKTKSKKDIYGKKGITEDHESQNVDTNMFERNVEPFNSVNFEGHSKVKSLQNACSEEEMCSIYSNLQNTNTYRAIRKLEHFDCLMYNVSKNEHAKKLQLKTNIESKNNITIINNLYSNRTQMVDNGTLNLVQINKNIVNSERICEGNNRTLQDNKCSLMENDIVMNQIKMSNSYNAKKDGKSSAKSGKQDDSLVDSENELRKEQSVSTIDAHKKSIAGSIKGNTDQHNVLGQHCDILDDIDTLINEKIKKRKKKNIGTCSFSLNNFSCHFLMTCDKT
ncbi:conserved Plasmodium protein, unknown function [Plasmodium knowlesi strain H]|uniref:Uncharacterized protein n=3 Tax=Plasmodium knowlesi TaxID=5850 RepID=A0A5K1V7X2_PLAKH|nr:conserved Plasmodium protein, unknown function [Plasmodium knowlesi strain H]OTN67190.1 Uncharacterized protein PKNOH_S07460900 [Plasmodium knowlesi]CAA9988734.1 conserved Plasmodium protein, unknown function [Plasmodium knowlesi strain H]SBO21684.1 conserved Plasmodium protein, unknown function [Plasmodium knowlesi strain H]SBO22052.1 conserved Plasmodium protein, unknown function [Plasmodium knowlesi strain H]VVS78208.1 conserved Plasmodium protein, unknown function [Plasmodium knowlesi s|eukprot:XP_002259710.1 hypothetical protein, conserved in Plasmodium species [Plasmodium knowlesi strain H]